MRLVLACSSISIALDVSMRCDGDSRQRAGEAMRYEGVRTYVAMRCDATELGSSSTGDAIRYDVLHFHDLIVTIRCDIAEVPIRCDTIC